MTEAAAREQLREIVTELEAIRLRLLGVHVSLPVPEEAGEEQDDAVTLRSIIQCVLSDSLEPAIRDLRTAATDRPDDLDATWDPLDV